MVPMLTGLENHECRSVKRVRSVAFMKTVRKSVSQITPYRVLPAGDRSLAF